MPYLPYNLHHFKNNKKYTSLHKQDYLFRVERTPKSSDNIAKIYSLSKQNIFLVLESKENSYKLHNFIYTKK